MKIQKSGFQVFMEEFKRYWSIIFFLTPLVFFIGTIMMGIGIFVEYKAIGLTSQECLKLFIIDILCLIIYVPIWYKIISKMVEKSQKKEAQEKEVRLQGLKSKYSNFIAIVNEAIKEQLSNIQGEFSIYEDYDYLLMFEDYLNKVDSRDSFVLASCLIYGLLKVEPRIKCESRDNGSDLYITADIAISSAFRIISEPVTYYWQGEECIEEKHPKVDIVLPNGVSKELNLYNRIANTILVQANEKVTALSIMQMANLLHLIYLNSSNK